MIIIVHYFISIGRPYGFFVVSTLNVLRSHTYIALQNYNHFNIFFVHRCSLNSSFQKVKMRGCSADLSPRWLPPQPGWQRVFICRSLRTTGRCRHDWDKWQHASYRERTWAFLTRTGPIGADQKRGVHRDSGRRPLCARTYPELVTSCHVKRPCILSSYSFCARARARACTWPFICLVHSRTR